MYLHETISWSVEEIQNRQKNKAAAKHAHMREPLRHQKEEIYDIRKLHEENNKETCTYSALLKPQHRPLGPIRALCELRISKFV